MITVYPPLEVPVRAPRRPAFPFDRPELRLTHLGRGAVWLAFKALGLGAGSRAAMPAYHCGSEVEAARLVGAEVTFYRVDASLQVDEEDLARVATAVDAVYLISNFGFPVPAAPRGVRVIADAAHALFSTGTGAADATIFCPRKSLGVPDGGALLTLAGPTWPERRAQRRERSSARAGPTWPERRAQRRERSSARAGPTWPERRAPARRIARSVAALAVGRASETPVGPVHAIATRGLRRASRADAAAERGDLTDVVIGEWDLSVHDMETAALRPSRLTAWAAPRADGDRIRRRRRANYERLAADLGSWCPTGYRELPAGVCPLYLPVATPDRNRVLRELLARGVRAIEVWPVPHPLLDRERFAELEPLRRNLLALPVHQLLDETQIKTVRDAAVAALRQGA